MTQELSAPYIAKGVAQFDSLLGGRNHISACFLIEGDAPALIEAGAQMSVPAIIEALTAHGLTADALRWIIVTHIHLDHAGGVGDLLAAFPQATVVVHPIGARHLIDPTRLIASAALVYGAALDTIYGRMTPAASDRVHAAENGEVITVTKGQKTLRIIHSPGHAKHHLAVLDEATGCLMVGDAVGVLIPEVGILRPATPPADFDLELAIQSLQTFRALNPTSVVLTHYGPVPHPIDTLISAEALLTQWVNVAEDTMRVQPESTVKDVAHAFEIAFAHVYENVDPAELTMFELLNGLESNAAGIMRYLSFNHDRLGGGTPS